MIATRRAAGATDITLIPSIYIIFACQTLSKEKQCHQYQGCTAITIRSDMKPLFNIEPDWNIIMKLSQENIKNLELRWFAFLEVMYKDDYYPNHVVDKGKAILINLCLKIEAQKPQTLKELYVLTHHATDQFNELENDFYENGSGIETIARDCIGGNFAFIAEVYGFVDADSEELIATRDW